MAPLRKVAGRTIAQRSTCQHLALRRVRMHDPEAAAVAQEVVDLELLARHDDVSEAAIIGVEDEKFGQALKAFVVPCSGKKPSEDALKKYVKENLANYKVPKEWVFLDELPRNATGKVLKKDLKEHDGEGEDEDSEAKSDEKTEKASS